MKSLIIRDDDLSYYTLVEYIDNLYKSLFDKRIKISFATIPFSVNQYHLGNIGGKFYQIEDTEKPIGANSQIVEYIKEKIDDGVVEIMLHGYNHLYSFECDGKIEIATKENLDKCRKANKKIKFIGEYNYQNYESLNKKTKIGKEYLEDIFKVKIKNFVPPSNQINKDGIKAIIDNGLNLSGLIGKNYNRELTFRGLINYIDRIIFALKHKNLTYPKIADYGKHKELVGYALTPSTDWDRYYKQLEFCIKHNYPFQIATHYWELDDDLKRKLYGIIDILLSNNYDSVNLKEIL